MAHTPGTVAAVVTLLETAAVACDLFGGGAEALLGVRPEGPHRDTDLIHRAESFNELDAVLQGLARRITIVAQKWFVHESAVRQY